MRDQLQIVGTERPSIPAVEDAANSYRRARDERMEMTKLEVVRRDELIRIMRENGVTVYKFDGPDGEELTATLKEEVKVKVSSQTPDEDA